MNTLKKLLYAFGIAAFILFCGCSKNDKTNSIEELKLPSLSTIQVSEITSASAVSGGNITNDGGSPITERGICYSTDPNPTNSNTLIKNGTGTGNYSVNISNLTAKTTYYIRAYATNSIGTAYGNELNFITADNIVTPQLITDIDGNKYHSITIGTQKWMLENLNVSHYRNGDTIPQVSSGSWGNLQMGAWCYYQSNSQDVKTYGKLYNWSAASDPRGLAPAGWHIPSDAEWTTLYNYCSGELYAGAMLKEEGTTHWLTTNLASNSSGFTGLPGGNLTFPQFTPLGTEGWWWSSTASGDFGNCRGVKYNTRKGFIAALPKKSSGLSIRCIKD